MAAARVARAEGGGDGRTVARHPVRGILGCAALAGVLGVVAVVVFFVWVTADDPPVTSAPVARLTAEQLALEYRSNELAAEARYRGQVIAVSGTIQDISSDATGKPYLLLRVRDGLGIQCVFARDMRDGLTRLSVGNAVALRGLVSGTVASIVVLRGCVADQAEQTPLKPTTALPAAAPPTGEREGAVVDTKEPDEAPPVQKQPDRLRSGITDPATRRWLDEPRPYCRWVWNGEKWVADCEEPK